MAKENIIIDKTFEFSLRIIELYKYLTIEKKEYILSKQLLQSEQMFKKRQQRRAERIFYQK